MTPEEKVLQKIRKLLLADTTISGMVSTRIYTTHVSTIDEPKYPCISLHPLLSQARLEAPTVIDMQIQIDAWLPASGEPRYTTTDVMTLHRRIRALLHLQNLTDSTLSLVVMSVRELTSGPSLYEEDTNLIHYPIQYQMTAL